MMEDHKLKMDQMGAMLEKMTMEYKEIKAQIQPPVAKEPQVPQTLETHQESQRIVDLTEEVRLLREQMQQLLATKDNDKGLRVLRFVFDFTLNRNSRKETEDSAARSRRR